LKQKKTLCVHALLIIGASQDIANDDGLFANDLSQDLYSKSLSQLRQDSAHELIQHMHPRDYFLLPDLLIYRHLSRQSTYLMEQGRCEYSAPPLSHRDIIKRLNGHHQQPSHSLLGHSNSLDNLSDSIGTSSYSPKRGYLSDVMQQHNSSMSLLSSADNVTQDHRSLLGNQQFSIFCYNTIEDVVDMLRRQAHLLSRFDAEERLKSSGLSLLAGENQNAAATAATSVAGGGASGVGHGSIGEVGSHVSQESQLSFVVSSNERQKVLIEAQKSLSSYSMLSKILTSEKKKGRQHHNPHKRSSGGIGTQNLQSGPSLTMDNIRAVDTLSAAYQTNKQFSRSENDSSHHQGGDYLSCIDMPYRHITSLSTRSNLIHMKIGDQGLDKICKVLPGNSFIQSIILSTARITSVGFQSLLDILSLLPCLTYLDLSQNAINDDGAHSLAVLLSNSVIMKEKISLERITLMGNRITGDGAKPLVSAVLMSDIHYLK
jgi:hypothetical protein